MTPRRPRALRILARLALAAVAGVAALGGAELVLHHTDWEPAQTGDVHAQYPTVRPAAGSGAAFGLAPGREIRAQYDGDPYDTLPDGDALVYQLNAWGFRDAAWGRSDAGPRLAVLWDSFAFGEGVARDARLGEVAAAALGEALGQPVDPYNLAVPGYASVEQRQVAEALLPRIRPAAVVLVYCLNDPAPLDGPHYQGRLGHDLIRHRAAFGGPPRGAVEDPPVELLYLWRLARERRARQREGVRWYRSLYRGDDAPWLASRDELARIAAAAEAQGASFTVVLFPILHRVGVGYPFAREHRTIRRWCEQQGIELLDARAVLRGRSTRALVVHPRDHHPNAAAHGLVGEALAAQLAPRLDQAGSPHSSSGVSR